MEKLVRSFALSGALILAMAGVLMVYGSPAEGATAIGSCGTISAPGNYFLTRNLATKKANCVTLTASNINIDLNGHTIAGDGTHSGITGNNLENIIINNGTIKGFKTGINLTISSGFLADDTISNVRAIGNTGGGIFIGGCCNSFRNIGASSNGGIGIENDMCCSTLNSVTANNNGGTSNSNGDGMRLVGCCYVVQGSQASGNQGIGINETGPGGDNCCTLVDNTEASHNGSHGIELDGCCSMASFTTTNLNLGTGIILRFCSTCSDQRGNNQVLNATANGNSLDGIEFASGFRNAITNVTAKNNHGLFGVFMTCPATVSGVTATGNVTNLGESPTSAGACTDLNNKAP